MKVSKAMPWFYELCPTFDFNCEYSIYLKVKGGRKTYMTGFLFPVENGVHIAGGKTIHIYKNRIIKIEKSKQSDNIFKS